MDIVRLLQPLEHFPHLDVVQYYAVTSFLADPSMENLNRLIPLLDNEVKHLPTYSHEQSMCVRYIYRDWAYQYLKGSITRKETQALFMIENDEQKPGFFLDAIDFIKRNPKDNQALMRFSLSLLLHSKNQTNEIKQKTEATEQLMSSISIQSNAVNTYSLKYKKHTFMLATYVFSLACICVMLIRNLQLPLI